jgi:hypothetical protein
MNPLKYAGHQPGIPEVFERKRPAVPRVPVPLKSVGILRLDFARITTLTLMALRSLQTTQEEPNLEI